MSSAKKPDVKSIGIGILVAYVAFDLMYGLALSKSSSTALENAANSITTSSGVVAILISIALGGLVWYLFSRPPTPNRGQ